MKRAYNTFTPKSIIIIMRVAYDTFENKQY